MYNKLYYVFCRLSKHASSEKMTAWYLLSLIEMFLCLVIVQIAIKFLEGFSTFTFDNFIVGREAMISWSFFIPAFVILILNGLYFRNKTNRIVEEIEQNIALSKRLARFQLPVFIASILILITVFAIGNVR